MHNPIQELIESNSTYDLVTITSNNTIDLNPPLNSSLYKAITKFTLNRIENMYTYSEKSNKLFKYLYIWALEIDYNEGGMRNFETLQKVVKESGNEVDISDLLKIITNIRSEISIEFQSEIKEEAEIIEENKVHYNNDFFKSYEKEEYLEKEVGWIKENLTINIEAQPYDDHSKKHEKYAAEVNGKIEKLYKRKSGKSLIKFRDKWQTLINRNGGIKFEKIEESKVDEILLRQVKEKAEHVLRCRNLLSKKDLRSAIEILEREYVIEEVLDPDDVLIDVNNVSIDVNKILVELNEDISLDVPEWMYDLEEKRIDEIDSRSIILNIDDNIIKSDSPIENLELIQPLYKEKIDIIEQRTEKTIIKLSRKIRVKNYRLKNLKTKLESIVKRKNKSKIMRHFLSIDDLNKTEIEHLVERGTFYSQNQNPELLKNELFYNIFFEESTRTITAFQTAAMKLGAMVINLNMKNSSISKGETEIDTIKNIEAMGAKFIAIRHPENMMAHICAKHCETATILNAGDGCNEHPSQALGDLLTIHHKVADYNFEKLKNLKIVLCGDIKHSRVAHSHIKLYSLLGMKNVHLVSPPELSSQYDYLHKNLHHHFKLEDAIPEADVISAFRFKKEYNTASSGTIDDFGKFYQINHETIKAAKPNVKIMHPGPINRGVELSGKLADDKKFSLILEQVTYGIAMRQSIIEFCYAQNITGSSYE